MQGTRITISGNGDFSSCSKVSRAHLEPQNMHAPLIATPKRAATHRFRPLWQRIRLAGAALVASALTAQLTAQPVNLGVQRSNDTVVVFWPAGLDLVQPQKRTNLTVGAWQDLGAATTASALTENDTTAQGYYRLRFLAPNITAHPQGKTNATGSNVTFSVNATGTAPLAYQWRKDNTPLVGKTDTVLGLTNLALGDAGSYTVVVTNRAGSITSIVAVLSVTNPLVRPAGIYMGNFAGQVDNGGFAAMVRSNGSAVAVGYNTPQEEGLFISSFTVADNGGFSAATAQSGNAAGTFTSTNVNGTFVNSSGGTGGFRGNRKSDTGTHANNAGYYTGTYSGQFQGSAFAILAADGSIFFYTIDNPTSPTADGDGGGFGTINAANSFSGTTVPVGLTVSGTLNTTTKVLSGAYRSGSTTLGSFTLARTSTP